MKGLIDSSVGRVLCALGTLGALMAGDVLAQAQDAQAMQRLARERNCLTCHATDRTLIAPSLREIAKRYVGQADAATQLTASITDGSRGKWGSLPMPAGTQLAPGEATQLATWILTLGH